MHTLHDTESHLKGFYTSGAGHVGAVLALAFLNWLLGAMEIWFVFQVVQPGLSFADA